MQYPFNVYYKLQEKPIAGFLLKEDADDWCKYMNYRSVTGGYSVR